VTEFVFPAYFDRDSEDRPAFSHRENAAEKRPVALQGKVWILGRDIGVTSGRHHVAEQLVRWVTDFFASSTNSAWTFRHEAKRVRSLLGLVPFQKHRRSKAHNPNKNNPNDDEQCRCAHSKRLPFLRQLRELGQNRGTPHTRRSDVPATNTARLIADSARSSRFLYADPSPRHEMQDQKNEADDQQNMK
jgi:hypothetical protein